jgi:hypothetical protein
MSDRRKNSTGGKKKSTFSLSNYKTHNGTEYGSPEKWREGLEKLLAENAYATEKEKAEIIRKWEEKMTKAGMRKIEI